MSRITERISSIVESQFPEYVGSDFPKFVSFVQAYYRFLEQDQGAYEVIQNALQYNDIDKTTDTFVEYFVNTYGKDFPSTTQIDRRLLVKKLNDIYSSKGSAVSFKTLFRLLYDKTVEVSRPYDYVLKPSDGVWEQRVSVRVRTAAGSFDDITNRILLLEKNGLTYKSSIIRVKELSSSLCEIFVNSNTTAPFELDDVVTVKSASGTIFTGIIDPTLTEYAISQGGEGFRVGQVFTVNLSGGVNSAVKILSVDENGSITALRFINYGYNYQDDITVNLLPNLTTSSTTKGFASKTDGYSENLSALAPQSDTDPERYFFSDYLVGGSFYTGTIVISQTSTQSYTGGTTTGTELPAGAAVITFNIGAIGRYPGQYNSTQGFLSEPGVNLQNSKLYQPFAYQLETDTDISVFYNVVKTLVHPAGASMFNNRVITNTLDISDELTVTSSVA